MESDFLPAVTQMSKTATDTITMKDFKRAVNMIKDNCIPLDYQDFVLVFPEHYREHQDKVDKIVEHYRKIGRKVKVVFDGPVKMVE